MRTQGRVVLFALLMLASAAIAAGPDLQRAEELLRANKAQEAYDLLEPFEFDLAGELKYDYLLGLAALESGKPEKSSLVFERVLAVEPRYLGVRLDLARSYYQMGDIARAAQEFQAVLAQEPPPDLRANAEQYLKAIEQAKSPKRFSLSAYVEIGGGYDSNVNSSTSDNPILLPGANNQPFFLDDSSLEQEDSYGTIGVGAEAGYLINSNWSVYAGGDARYRGYQDIDTANYGTVDSRAGVALNVGRHLFRLGATGGRFFLDQHAYRDSYGANGEWRYQAGDRDQLSVTGQYSAYRHLSEVLEVNDFDQALVSLGWLHVLASGQTLFSLNVNGGHEDDVGGRPDGAANLAGARLFVQTAMTEKLGIFTTAGAQFTRYDNVSTSFLEHREDWLYDVTLGLNWQFTDKWSVRPQVSFTKNESNIPLNNFKRGDVALNLRRDFRW
jgi:tetratricopeptide (TPR) repeat protein